MTDQDQLEELLNRWEDLCDQGHAVSEEEFCRNCPELLAEFRRRVAELRQIDRFLICGTSLVQEELTAAGRYRPLQLYAHGGLGEVFVARDDELGREVALKRMRVLDAVNVQRARHFQFEAEITGRLDHPGVVPVYGLGHDASGRLYYAMRFIRGETLQQAIEQFHRAYPLGKDLGARTIAFQKLIRSFLAVCQTIGYAHSQGVVHRDLKPANIMLGHYGETLVVDWGLAKRLPQQPGVEMEGLDTAVASTTTVTDETLLGQIKGSPAYMSPEQAEGHIGRIGPLSDIYGLGATLFTILAGKSPFADMELPQLLERVKRGDFPRPCHVRSDVSPALEAICLKAMSLEPGGRYATALDLAADLEHWLADDPVSAWSEPWTSRAMRWVRKHQTLTSTVAAAVVVALLGISAVAVQQQQSNQTLGEKNQQLADDKVLLIHANEAVTREAHEKGIAAKRAEKSETKALEAEKQARRDLYSFLIVAADRALDYGDRSFAEEALDNCPEILRNVEWRLLYHRTTGSRQTWRFPQASIPSVDRSGDGKLIAVANLNGPVQVINVVDGRVVAQIAGPAGMVAFLPDGDYVLVRSKRDSGPLELWSISQRKKMAQLSPSVECFALSGDGKRIALVSVAWPTSSAKIGEIVSSIEICDATNGHRIAATGKIPGQVAGVAFSPNHDRLYSIVRQFDATRQDPANVVLMRKNADACRFQLQAWKTSDSQEPLRPVFSRDGPEEANAAAMAISPDGKKILVSDRFKGRHGRILVLDAATGETVTANGYDVDSLEPVPATTRERPTDVLASDRIGRLAISPDGKRLAVVNGCRVMVFDWASGQRLAVLAGHLSVPQCVVFDHDSNGLLTAGGDDGQVKRWDLSHPLADRIVFPSGQAVDGRGVAFSADSRHMAVAEADGGIEIYEVATGRPQLTVPPISTTFAEDKLRDTSRSDHSKEFVKATHGGYRASGMQFSSDGQRLTVIYYNRTISVWDISGAKPRVLDFFDAMALDKGQGSRMFTHLLLSPGGKYLAGAFYREADHDYRVWEIENRRLVVSRDKLAFSDVIPKMAFTRNGHTFLLARSSPYAEPPVIAWNLATGKPVEVPGGTDRDDSFDQVSPDGTRRLRIVGGVIKIEDCQSSRKLIEFGDQDSYLWAISSPDGNYILACKEKIAELLDASPIANRAEK